MFVYRFVNSTHAESPPTLAGAFVPCPASLLPAADEFEQWRQLFEWAYREAQAVARTSRVERLQRAAVN
jgi:hypothetical protein